GQIGPGKAQKQRGTEEEKVAGGGMQRCGAVAVAVSGNRKE
ncbi:hypothetical protein L195_g046919, partial [Trifolium pratense]